MKQKNRDTDTHTQKSARADVEACLHGFSIPNKKYLRTKKMLLCLVIFTTISYRNCSAIDKPVIISRAIRTCLGIGRLASQVAKHFINDKNSKAGRNLNKILWRISAGCELGMALSSMVDEYYRTHYYKSSRALSATSPASRTIRSICELTKDGDDVRGNKTSLAINALELAGQLFADWGEFLFKGRTPETHLAGDITRISSGLMGNVLGTDKHIPDLFDRNPSLFLYFAEAIGPIRNYWTGSDVDTSFNGVDIINGKGGSVTINHVKTSQQSHVVRVPNSDDKYKEYKIYGTCAPRSAINVINMDNENFDPSNEDQVAAEMDKLFDLKEEEEIRKREGKVGTSTVKVNQAFQNSRFRKMPVVDFEDKENDGDGSETKYYLDIDDIELNFLKREYYQKYPSQQMKDLVDGKIDAVKTRTSYDIKIPFYECPHVNAAKISGFSRPDNKITIDIYDSGSFVKCAGRVTVPCEFANIILARREEAAKNNK